MGVALLGLTWHCRGSDLTVTHGPEPSVRDSELRGAQDSPAPTGMAPAPHDAGQRRGDPAFAAALPEVDITSATAPLISACGSGRLTPIGEHYVARRPYVQNVTATSAVILLTTRELGVAPALVLTRPSGELVQVVVTEADPADVSGHQRFARLSGLDPDTIYCYELDEWVAPVGFRSAPQPFAGARMRFVAFGDSGGASRVAVREAMALLPFELMLHVGDIAYESGSIAELETKFFDTYAELIAHLPIFPASGNHEYRTQDAAPYRQVFALPENGGPDGVERWFSFDWGDVHFVALDTEQVGAKQASWLERDLTDNGLPWTVVYMHKPAYSSGKHGSSLDVRQTFAPIFEQFGVQLVLAGHDHDYERMKIMGGVTYVVTGGGGYSARRVGNNDFTALSEATLHFVHGEVQGDEMLLRAINPSGDVLDSIRIARLPSADTP
jgi:calcineurin-like phosphoesterase family protein